MIEKFSLDHVGKSAGVLNTEKLLDLNAWHIRESSDDFLVENLMPFLRKMNIQDPNPETLKELLPLLKPRSKTLVEMAENAKFCFVDTLAYDEKGDRKFLKPDVLNLLDDLATQLSRAGQFNQEELEKIFVSFLDQKEIKLKKIAQPLRMALTGKTASPGIFEVMQVLGKEKTVERIKRAVDHIRKK